MQFAVENQADVISYFDHYVPPELIEIVVDRRICTYVCAGYYKLLLYDDGGVTWNIAKWDAHRQCCDFT